MESGSTILLKLFILIIGITVLWLCIFWLPWRANVTSEINSEDDYIQYPVLKGVYVEMILYFVAFYDTVKLLIYIHKNTTLSEISIKALIYETKGGIIIKTFEKPCQKGKV